MTQQEHIDQLIRIHIGDMVVQIVMLKAQIASLETAVAEAQAAAADEAGREAGKRNHCRSQAERQGKASARWLS